MSEREPVLHRGDIELPLEGGTVSRYFKGADYAIDAKTGCWVWQRGVDAQGYGRLGPASGLERRAHREYFKRAHGEIPAGFHVHHRCHNRLCVNPAHLEGTSATLHQLAHQQFDSDLNWDDVHALREAYARGGASIQELGERYGLGKSQVYNIVTNVKWHDPGFTPGRVVVCVLEECRAEFIARRSNQRFCCHEHMKLWSARRRWRRAHGKPLDGPSRWRGAKDAA